MKKLFLALATLTFLVSACGKEAETTKNQAETTEKQSSNDTAQESTGLNFVYDTKVENEGEVVEGARLQYALASDTPFAGILNFLWYEGNPDVIVILFFNEYLYETTADRTYLPGKNDNSIAWYEMSDDLLTKTIHVKEGVKWHDGEEFTVDDIIMGIEIVSDSEYTGVRFYEPYNYIVGAQEKKDGKADSVSGIKKIDDYTMTIEFTKKADDYLYISEFFVPEHIFKDIPVAEMASSDAVRKNPIGVGPFKIASMVPGEAVKFDAFEDYHLGKPKLAGVDLKVVNPNVINKSFETGEIDMASSYSTSNFDEANIGDNVQYVQRIESAYNYMGFKLGKRNLETNTNETDPAMKMADVNLRQAMGYSLNNQAVAEGLYNNFRMPANSIVGPMFPTYHNAALEGFTYDPKKSMEILDKAGYIDVDGDGLREDPSGNKLVINAAFMSGSSAEDYANFYLQGFNSVGLDVRLLDGRLMEFNSFYERIGEDDPELDIYFAAWGTGYNPNPSGLYGKDASFNYTRYFDDELAEILGDINSEEALTDEALKKDAYNRWQEAMFEKAATIPTLYRTQISPINNRVKNFDWQFGPNGTGWHGIELIAEKPFPAS